MFSQDNIGNSGRVEGGTMIKRYFVVLLALALIAVACGGGNEDTNPAAFGPTVPSGEICEQVPANVPGITIAGQRVAGITDLEVCVEALAAVGVVPVVRDQPQCGNPCLTLEITGLNASVDTGIIIRMTRDGNDEELGYDLDHVSIGDSERWCLVGVGTPDPCVERITTPTGLQAKAAKKRGVLNLSWQASTNTGSAEVTGYEVYRSETGEPGTFVPAGTSSGTTLKQAGLTSGTTYSYYVIALDGNGNHSEASNVAQGTPR